MRRLVISILLAGVLSAMSLTVWGQVTRAAEKQAAAPKASDAQKNDFFPLEQLKPGMRAIGYTVFSGSEPKPFELEILGVLKGFQNPQQSAVLSKLVGDVAAHQIGRFQRGVRDWGRQTGETLLRDGAEYLQQEAQALPPRHAVEQFLSAVDVLREDADRLAARVDRLRRRLSGDPA